MAHDDVVESTEDEDEILVALSEELGGFVDLVGGPDHASCLLEPLETLVAVEETVVRDKAVIAINNVVQSIADATDCMVPLLQRLTEGDWFTSRVSACSLFSVAYTRIATPSTRKEMREYVKVANRTRDSKVLTIGVVCLKCYVVTKHRWSDGQRHPIWG